MSTTLDQVSETQANKATTVNEIVEALSRAGLFGIRRSTTSALTFGYYGGELWVNGVLTTIADGTLALTASVTNYIEATYAGVVSKNTTGFTAGRIPLYELVTNGSGITTVTDRRICNLPMWGYLSLSVAGGAGTTVLTAAEARVHILKCTGALTGNRNVELPATPWRWVVENATSGAFTLTFKTNAGTGVAVTQGKKAVLYGDGTDIYSEMTDITAIGSMTSAQLKAVVSDETGSGALVFADTPTLVTPVLGVATATSIQFGAGNALNVYATGTWNPVRNGFTEVIGGGSITNTGTYTRIGNIVYLQAKLLCAGGATLAAVAGASYLSGAPLHPADFSSGKWVDIGTGLAAGFANKSTADFFTMVTGWAAATSTWVIDTTFKL